MDEHLEFLRIENKKLRGKHNELESDLTEEKEMVKYLHGVIKNYQQLLKKPETTRHLKTASLKKPRRSNKVRRLASDSDAEEFFVKKLVEMSIDRTKDEGGEGYVFQSCEFATNKYKDTTVVDTSTYENTESVKARRQDQPDYSFSRTVIEDNIQAERSSDTKTPFYNVKKNTRSDSVRGKLDFPSEEEKFTETRSKYTETGNILQEMTQMLDSMMAKAIMHENALKQKDKHLKRMERRYEYLASIALGEESEWL